MIRYFDLCGRCGIPISPSPRWERMCRDCCDVTGVKLHVEPVPDGHKRCSRCSVVKPYSGFYRNPGIGDGYKAQCRDCQSAEAAARWQRKKAGVA